MDALWRLAEQRIDEAVQQGQLDDLPGKGKPLELEDLSAMPDELRASYLLLRGSGFLPEEMQLRKDLVELRGLLAACLDDGTRGRLQQRITAKTLRYELLMRDRGITAAHAEYESALRARLGAE
ncbi:MAG: DUF1992 domain-containing protein [Planctomycetes bacterium]|nr:DUF1992 domain-containing protein [Planctomycetota bacterium]MCB9872493.1 DUF1992 domain-containing protein [Planctomycetota bacterium]MCB9888642.1 DUF1992 domain-containing protein [Planctomycetota bacterium]